MARALFNHPWVDEKRAPIYMCKFPDPIAADQYEAYLVHLENWVSKTTEPYAWVIYPDLKTPKQRAAMAESQARRAVYEKLYCSCYGFVVTHPMMRGVITAVLWLNSPVVVTKVFEEEGNALVWVSQTHARFLENYRPPGG